MGTQKLIRWAALFAALSIVAAAGFVAARFGLPGRVQASPAPGVTVTTLPAPTITPTPAALTPIPEPALTPVEIYFLQPVGDNPCLNELVATTYQVVDPNYETRLQFLLSEPGSDTRLNFLYGLPLRFEGAGASDNLVEIYLAGDFPYIDSCIDDGIERQLTTTLWAGPDVTTEIYINGVTASEFFAQRYFDNEYVPDPGPHVPSTIRGSLGYPAESVPALDVYAISVSDPSYIVGVTTAPGDTTFAIHDLYGGDYYIVAQPAGGDGSFIGGYTQASICGLDASCTDHSLVVVSVEPGLSFDDVRLTDWGLDPACVPTLPKG